MLPQRGCTGQRKVVGEQSSGTWGQRVQRGGGQSWGDERWGTGWPWRAPGWKHLPREQLQRCRPGAGQHSPSGGTMK